MTLLEVIKKFVGPKKPKNKARVLIKSKFGLPAVRVCGVVLSDAGQTNQSFSAQQAASGVPSSDGSIGGDVPSLSGVQTTGSRPPTTFPTAYRTDGVEDLYLRSNEDAKDLIGNLSSVVAVSFGKANNKYEAIRVNYLSGSDNLNKILKIYSFTEGEKELLSRNDKQKQKCIEILESMNISSIIVGDLISFDSNLFDSNSFDQNSFIPGVEGNRATRSNPPELN